MLFAEVNYYFVLLTRSSQARLLAATSQKCYNEQEIK